MKGGVRCVWGWSLALHRIPRMLAPCLLYVEIYYAGHSGLVCSLGLGTAMLFVMHHVMAMLLRTPSTLGYPPTIPLGILLVVPRRLV